MEDFIKRKGDQLLSYKKNIFTQKHINEFITKLIERDDQKMVEKELTNCLLAKGTNLNPSQYEERKQFIKNFITDLNDLKKKEAAKNTTKNKNQNNNDDYNLMLKPIKIDDENFPTFEQNELMKRKKKFEVLDRHYQNRLEKGYKDCFCMSQKHPLVGICLNCGRIHCLQEGDNFCIYCGAKLYKKEEYLKNNENNLKAKEAYIHKEKLLNFQKEFYSKLQIIDDFTDWYDVSNNTWLDEKSRQIAKEKDEDNSQFTV